MATRHLQFRRDVLSPFFDQYLKTGAAKPNTPPVFIYNTGENHWDRLDNWPLACEHGLRRADEATVSRRPTSAWDSISPRRGSAADSYVSDPAKPVPYLPRPVRFSDSDRWRTVAGGRSAIGRRSD